jgi:hypothetical protein
MIKLFAVGLVIISQLSFAKQDQAGLKALAPETTITQSGEKLTSQVLEPGIRTVASEPAKLEPGKPLLLVFYALPNGNTIEQTMGRTAAPNLDWHYQIQQIAAQTRRARQILSTPNIVVIYLQAQNRSWPTWRRQHSDNAQMIGQLVDFFRAKYQEYNQEIALTAHSGGGSLVFGFINGYNEIPQWVERIALLDADYAYDEETSHHGTKLWDWLKNSPSHVLAVAAYDDRYVTFNGKRIVSESGGTYGRTTLLASFLSSRTELTSETVGQFIRHDGLEGRIDIRIHMNPERKILHTVLVERNGFLFALLAGRKSIKAETLWDDPGYTSFISKD